MSCSCEAPLRWRDRASDGAGDANALRGALRLPRLGLRALTPNRYASHSGLLLP